MKKQTVINNSGYNFNDNSEESNSFWCKFWLYIAMLVTAILVFFVGNMITSGNDKPILLHEYTVLDLNTKLLMVCFGDDDVMKWETDDSVYIKDSHIYPIDNVMESDYHKGIIISSYNQLD